MTSFSILCLNASAGSAGFILGGISPAEDDTGRGIVVDPGGHVYVMGYTIFDQFPVMPAPWTGPITGGFLDIFVAKLGSDRRPVFLSLWSGEITGIFARMGSRSTRAVISSSAGPPIPRISPRRRPPSTGRINGSYDAFLAKLDPQRRWLSYSTFVGGSSVDYGEDVAIDADGNPYLTGQTWSGDFPVTPNAYDSSHNTSGDAFLAKANPHGSNLLFSSYLGGANEDGGRAVDASGENEAVIAGMANSSGFPTSEWAFDETYNGSGDGFVTKLSISHSPQPPVRQTLSCWRFHQQRV